MHNACKCKKIKISFVMFAILPNAEKCSKHKIDLAMLFMFVRTLLLDELKFKSKRKILQF